MENFNNNKNIIENKKMFMLKYFINKKNNIINLLLCKNYYRFYIKCYIKENNINEDKNKEIEEKIIDLKREKQLKDLFYNKIIERKNYIHKKFSKFYYKGIMNEMKNKGKNNDKKINEVENKNINEENKNINNIENKNINNIENKNISNNNKIEAKIEEVKNINKDEKPKIIDIKLYKQKQLKNLFYNKLLEMKDYVHKYFMKFYYKGLYFQMKYPDLYKKQITQEKPNNNEIKKEEKSNNNNNNNNNDNNINNDNNNNNNNNINIHNDDNNNNKNNNNNNDNNNNNINQSSTSNTHNEYRYKSKNLKKILKEKEAKNKQLLKHYFNKFYRIAYFKNLNDKILIYAREEKIKKNQHYNFFKENMIKKINSNILKQEQLEKKLEKDKKTIEFIFYMFKRQKFLYFKKKFDFWFILSKIIRINSTLSKDKKFKFKKRNTIMVNEKGKRKKNTKIKKVKSVIYEENKEISNLKNLDDDNLYKQNVKIGLEIIFKIIQNFYDNNKYHIKITLIKKLKNNKK